MKKKSGIATQVVHLARNPKEQGWMVNPPIYQTSTIIFPKYKDLQYAERGYSDNEKVKPYELKYGRYGTQSNFTLEKAIAKLENGYNSFVTSSGAAAINTALIAFLGKGDHMLLVDNTYSPTRGFADKFLKKFGIETTYYDPNIGSDIKKLIKKNTKVIFLESPGSLSFEVQDVKAICKIAKEKNIITILDNSWASGIYFKPLNHGVDVSVMAATKYINGHSDVMMGSITVKKRHFRIMYEAFRYMAVTASPFSCYLTQRGFRTSKLRMDHCYKSALSLSKWLETKKEVHKVIYPALESHKDHLLWKRDFTGAAGLFTIILNKKYSHESLARMIDNLQYYGVGYSWGGYESLILPCNIQAARSVTKWQFGDKTCLRINVGLEDIEDLKQDLEDGFKNLNNII
jgi:cysteine-S-conjugate beta-lyase|tara:strand:- start:1168 stop:2373 length:1206 start_codon:yes stop_codon:yes gene_type:complete